MMKSVIKTKKRTMEIDAWKRKKFVVQKFDFFMKLLI